MVGSTAVIAQRDIWWADLGEPSGAEAWFHRPVVVIQSDALNASRHRTVICVPLTGNTTWRTLPWNLFLPANSTGLDKDSLAQAGLVFALDRERHLERIGRVSEAQLRALFRCLDLCVGR